MALQVQRTEFPGHSGQQKPDARTMAPWPGLRTIPIGWVLQDSLSESRPGGSTTDVPDARPPVHQYTRTPRRETARDL